MFVIQIEVKHSIKLENNNYINKIARPLFHVFDHKLNPFLDSGEKPFSENHFNGALVLKGNVCFRAPDKPIASYSVGQG